MRESAGRGETDAFPASEMPAGRRYDRVLALTRSGSTTEVLTLLDRLPARTPTTAVTADPTSPVVDRVDSVVMLDPASVALDAGDSQETKLQITNSAARAVTVAWHEVRTPAANPGFTIDPARGKLTIPAGATRGATLTATAPSNASGSTAPLRVDLAATAPGQPETQAGSVELRVRSRTHPYLSDLDWLEATSEWAEVTRDTYVGSSEGMTLNGVQYPRGPRRRRQTPGSPSTWHRSARG